MDLKIKIGLNKGIKTGAIGIHGGISDKTGPACAITSTSSGMIAGAFSVTITFTNPETGLPEVVTGFAVGDITTSANAGASNLANPSTGVYTATITPTASGTVTVDVHAGVCQDAAGNTNTAAVQFSILYLALATVIDPQTVTGNDGDAVSSYADGFTHTYAQVTETKQPVLKTGANGINSNKIFRFDGGDLLVCPSAFLTGTSGYVFAVYKLAADGDVSQVIFSSADEGTAGSYGFTIFCANTVSSVTRLRSYQRDGDTADDILGTTGLSADTVYLMIYKSDGSAYTARVNGADYELGVTSGANNGDWFGDTTLRDSTVVGASKSSSEALFFKGDLALLGVVENETLSVAVQTALEAYVEARFALNFS